MTAQQQGEKPWLAALEQPSCVCGGSKPLGITSTPVNPLAPFFPVTEALRSTTADCYKFSWFPNLSHETHLSLYPHSQSYAGIYPWPARDINGTCWRVLLGRQSLTSSSGELVHVGFYCFWPKPCLRAAFVLLSFRFPP